MASPLKDKPGLPALAALSLPLLLVASWHWLNRGYPDADCAYYFKVSQDLYFKYVQQGLGSALSGAYWERGKPILHPVFALPALIFTRGNVLLSVALTTTLFYLVFLGFTFKLFSRFLTPWRASLASLILGTMPWILSDAYAFDSQTPLLMCFVPALFYLLASDFFSGKRASIAFGFWLAMCLCVRPVEATLTFVPLISFALFLGFARKKLRLIDLLLPLAMIVTFVSYALLVIASYGRLDPGIGAVSAVLLVWPMGAGFLLRTSRFSNGPYRLSDPPLFSFSLAYSLCLIWFAPFLWDLYRWAGGSSFGVGSFMSRQPMASAWFLFIFGVLKKNAGVPALWLACAALLGCAGRSRHRKWPTTRPIAVCLITAIMLPVLTGALTLNGTLDYFYQTSSVLIMLSLLVLAPGGTARLEVLRTVLLAALLCAQVAFVASGTFAPHSSLRRGLEHVFEAGPWFAPPVRDEPAIRLLAELSRKIDPHKPARIAGIHQGHVRSPLLQHILLYTRERQVPWSLDDLWGDGDPEARLESSRESFDYLLLGPPGRSPSDYTLVPLSNRLYGTPPDQLAEMGYEYMGTIPYWDRFNLGHTLVLLKISTRRQ